MQSPRGALKTFFGDLNKAVWIECLYNFIETQSPQPCCISNNNLHMARSHYLKSTTVADISIQYLLKSRTEV